MPTHKEARWCPAAYWVARKATKWLLERLGPLRVEGSEHLPAAGAFLLVCNHVSNADPVALSAACPRLLRYMGKEELFRIPVLGWILRAVGVFPVRRGTPDRSAIRQAEAVLREGGVLALFPEGRESPQGTLLPFEPGAALLALRTGAPVIPAYIEGITALVPYGRVLPRLRRAPVVVRFGPPVPLADLAAADRRQALQIATERIFHAVAALAPVAAAQPHGDA
ncbi:MAG: lysophospholipid acyltransferase family protein [Armatimonadota bacterium]|nr:lysophospholipid acyltransferase family protein [Armatimonadota bacterium]